MTVDGSLNSVPRNQFRVELFGSPLCDDSGHGEGFRHLGGTTVTTDVAGDTTFSVPVAAVSDGDAVTATATLALVGSPKESSEFSACFGASCTSFATFGQWIEAQDKDNLTWLLPDHVRFVRGPLAGVSSYGITEAGERLDATSLDISAHNPSSGLGLYYLIRFVACGSWQTTSGNEPSRDTALP